MSKKMGSKLADSLRHARGGQEERDVEKPVTPVRTEVSETKPTLPPAVRPGAPSGGASRSTTFARQTDQSPQPSLDRRWDNLHPARIWPD